MAGKEESFRKALCDNELVTICCSLLLSHSYQFPPPLPELLAAACCCCCWSLDLRLSIFSLSPRGFTASVLNDLQQKSGLIGVINSRLLAQLSL